MKKLLTSILLTILLPLAAGAYDVEVGGIYYNLDDDAKTAEVTSGSTFYSGNIVIPSSITVNGVAYAVTSIGDEAFLCSDLTSLTIPSSVSSIGDRAFGGCVIMTSLTIPSSVTSIGESAFSDCIGLTTLTIPSSVRSIGKSAFWGCSGLTSLTILEGLKSIDKWAFGSCSGLTSLTIPSSVTSIGESAFSDCIGLTSLTILEGLTSIGPGAFLGCIGLTSLTIPSSVTSIGDAAFENCSGLTSLTISSSVTSIDREAFYGCSGLTSLTIPEGVTSIGMKAFSGCSGLTSLTIPSSLTSIDEEAFSGCSGLTSLTIPEGVTSIGEEAFSGCSGLASIIVEVGNKVFDSRGNCNAIIKTSVITLIVGCKNTVIPSNVWSIGEGAFCGCSDLTSVTIPSSVTSIRSSAFRDCSSLTSVTIPSNVKWISGSAFRGCSSLTSIAVEEGNTVYDSRDNCNAIIGTFDNMLIAGCKNTVIPSSVTSIGSFAFSGCSSLTSLTIPSSVTSIDAFAFSECSGLTSLTLPSSVTSIDIYAFYRCSGLTSLALPSSLTSISENAFSGCSGLTSVTIPSSVTSIGSGAFNNCRGLTSLTIPSSVTSIGSGAFENCLGLTYVTVGSKTPLSISWWTFFNCPNATLYVPYGCKETYEAAPYWKEFKEIVELDPLIEFADATVKTLCVENWDTNGDGELSMNEAAAVTDLGTVFSMSSIVTFNELQFFTGLTSISKAFSYCDKLLFITVPEGVTTIGDESFFKCKALTSVMLPNSVTSIGAKAFYECNDLLSMAIPSSVRTIGDEAFFGCSNLSSLSIPNGVTSIGRESFEYCLLESVVIPQSVTSIGQETFAYCGSLSSIEVESGNAVYDSRDKCNAIIRKSDNTLIAGCQTTEIPGSVTSIGTGAFRGSTGLTEITIPSSVTSIGDMAFWDCTNMILVISEIEEPKDIVPSTFSEQTYAGTLHVPAAAKHLYQQAQGWKNFQTIIEERVPTLFLTATPEGGAVDKGTKVTLSVKDDLGDEVTDAEIYYTLDGSEPSPKSTRYDQPITLTEAVTLRAVAMKEGYVRGEISATYTINKVLATGITLSETTVALTEGEEIVLMTTVTPDDAETTLTWMSSNEAVATVSQNGEVQAVAPGSATITVTTDNGISAVCEVTVEPKRVLPTSVTLSTSELTLTEGDDAKLEATVSPDDAETELTWSSDDESVVKVDGEGTVVGVSVGTATIMVTTDNGFLATCKVTVTERQQEHGEKQLVVVANLQAGEVAKGTEITLAVQDEDGETVDGADIYYTTDGRTPTQKSTHYEGVVTVNESMTLKAVAYKDGYTHSDVLRLAYIVIDDDSDLQWEDGESGVVYAFNTGDPMAKVQRVRSTAQGHVDIRESITVEGKTYTVTEIPKRAFAGASNVTSVTVPATVTTVGESAFANDGLLALIWQSNIEVPADALPEEGNRSKNFLLYVNRAGQAPYGMGNIVVKTADGYEMSEALTLIDGDNFHCPMAFRAPNVSYTHSYTMTTGLGSSEGWETLALPFDVETIRHSDGRTLVPFASWRSDSDNAPFWLYTLSADGFVKAGRIQANTPYILSMPNNEAYLSAYNVGGEVTFAASNATIQPSAALATATTGARTFVPTFRKIRSSSSVATLNSVNRLHSNTGGKAPGSRFISNLRLASPFEAVFEGSANAVRSFGLQFSTDGVNAIDEVPATRHNNSSRIYNLQGQRVSTMRKGNLYIMGGKKAMAK